MLAGGHFDVDLSPIAGAAERAAARPAPVRRDAEAPLELRRVHDPVPRQRHHRGDQPRQVLRVPLRRQAGRRAGADGAPALRGRCPTSRAGTTSSSRSSRGSGRACRRSSPRRPPPGRRGERLGAPLRGDRRRADRSASARLGRRRDLRRPGADEGLPGVAARGRDLAAPRGHRRGQRLDATGRRSTSRAARGRTRACAASSTPRTAASRPPTTRGSRVARARSSSCSTTTPSCRPGLMGRLAGHLTRDRSIGLLCPTTNFCGNEARVEPDYADDRGPARLRRPPGRASTAGRVFDIGVAAMYCVAARRDVARRGRPARRGLRRRHVRGRRLRGPHAREGLPRRVRRGRLRPPRRPGGLPQALARGLRRALEEEPGLLREEVRRRVEEARPARRASRRWRRRWERSRGSTRVPLESSIPNHRLRRSDGAGSAPTTTCTSANVRGGVARGDQQARPALPGGHVALQPAVQEVRVLLRSVAREERAATSPGRFSRGWTISSPRRSRSTRSATARCSCTRSSLRSSPSSRTTAAGVRHHQRPAHPAGGRRLARRDGLRPARVLDRRRDRGDDGPAPRREPREDPERPALDPRGEGAPQVGVPEHRRQLRGPERQLQGAAAARAPARAAGSSTSSASTRCITSLSSPARLRAVLRRVPAEQGARAEFEAAASPRRRADRRRRRDRSFENFVNPDFEWPARRPEHRAGVALHVHPAGAAASRAAARR